MSLINHQFRNPVRNKIKESHSTLVKRDVPSVYQVKVTKLYSSEAAKIQKFAFGTESKKKTSEKVLMLVGATGAGKTTLINGLFNFITGVEWDDPFRFRLVDEVDQVKGKTQAKSQTSWITSYTIHWQPGFAVPYTFTLIDTPGFGDTQSIEGDKEITNQFGKLFRPDDIFGIDYIDALGFVVQAVLPRLTITQKYIFDSVLSLFGKDIAENIFMFLTFADGQKPQALAAIGSQGANIPYKLHFKVNNSALFAENNIYEDGGDEGNINFDEMLWKMTNKSYKNFLSSHLDKMDSKSLILSKRVLGNQDHLTMLVKEIHSYIHNGIVKSVEIARMKNEMQEWEREMKSNENFKYEVKYQTWEKISVGEREALNCTECERTCHYPCKHLMVASCKYVSLFSGCDFCDCSIKKHKKQSYKYEFITKVFTKINEEMWQKCEVAGEKVAHAIGMKRQAENEMTIIQAKLIDLTKNARNFIEELNKIALKPSVPTTCDYIDLLIEAEIKQATQGWKQRLSKLQEDKNIFKLMMKLFDTRYDPLKELVPACLFQ